MAKHQGRLELTWTDKDKTLLSVGDGRYDYSFVDPGDYRAREVRLLEYVERIERPMPEGRPEGLPEPTSDNLLITGDAMHALDSLSSIPEYAEKYLGKIKLVYIDPPFNTGQAFSSYEDNIEHSVWLTMLRDRLRQIKPLLADAGSVWVHLDHAEVHRCRVVMDEELGEDNFVAEVAWQKATSPRNDTKGMSVSQDTILVYRASDAWVPNRMDRLATSNTTRYRSRDGDPVPWRDGDATAGKAATNHPMVYAIQHPVTGGLMYPTKGRTWSKSQKWFLEQLNEYARYELRDIDDARQRATICTTTPDLVQKGVPAIMLAEPLETAAASARRRHDAGMWPDLVFLDIEKEKIQRKKHLRDDGRVPETLWMANEVGGSLRGKNEVIDLFPDSEVFSTPKPEALLQRVIRIGSNPGDRVLDCFAGSGSTAAVAHKMGRRWVAIELLEKTADTFTKPRLAKVVRGEDPGGVTTTTTRVAEEGVELPAGLQPTDAYRFQSVLRKLVSSADEPLTTVALDKELAKIVRKAQEDGTTPLDTTETKTLLALIKKIAGSEVSMRLDVTKQVQSHLNQATKTRDELVTNWHGGGGFSHLKVRPSMFVEAAGMILLDDWATQGELAKGLCAQIGVRFEPEGIFAGRKGRTRVVVLDGLVGESTVDAILDRLDTDEVLHLWATQIDEGAAMALVAARPGSRLSPIPEALVDQYRRSPRQSVMKTADRDESSEDDA